VGLAARGLRDMDTGPEAIDDAAVLAQVRRQARRVHLRSLAFAIACTGLALLLP
jgi:hypothetical protein